MLDDARAWRTPAALIALGTVLRLVIGAHLPLVPDEAYYWAWSTHLAAGYFDHPPLLAWLIRVGTVLLGHNELGVRIGPIACGTVATVATTAIAGRVAGDKARTFAATAMIAMPLAAAGLVLATPDAPLLGAFAATLYCVVRAIESPLRSRESLRWWSVAGVALGLAFSSKYTSILLPVGALVAFVSHRDLRRRFAEPGPYVACLVATLVFLPVLLWNASHDWLSFAYQLEHGLGASSMSLLRRAWRFEGDLLGGQAGLVSPVLFVMTGMAVVSAIRAHADERRHALAVVSATAFLFFVYSALRKHVEPNWPAPAYVGGIALFAAHAWGTRAVGWARAAVTIAGVLTALIYVHAAAPILPIPPARDPLGRAYGWDALAAGAERAAAAPTLDGSTAAHQSWIAADRYQDASEIAFYAPRVAETFALNLNGRRNQYELWPRFADRAKQGDRLVVAVDESPEIHPVVAALAPHFRSILRGELVEMRRDGAVIGARRIYSLDGWTGGWPAAASAR